LDGHKVLAVNATCLMSEIGERLAQGRPFGATYFVREDGKRVWSLRSCEGGIDVSDVARRRGGGGHRAAAGFTEG
jgi:nanoRNase/pAp phosphatase (c-di-AMP/oligoRNAs hydrolase)